MSDEEQSKAPSDGGAPKPKPERAPEEDEPRSSPFGPGALVIIALLVGGTWWVIQELSASTKMQDCIQSGRRNCAPIEDNRP